MNRLTELYIEKHTIYYLKDKAELERLDKLIAIEVETLKQTSSFVRRKG
ncbi:MAG: hypothetical protein JXR07_07715 [Reichenbachiella sp.]